MRKTTTALCEKQLSSVRLKKRLMTLKHLYAIKVEEFEKKGQEVPWPGDVFEESSYNIVKKWNLGTNLEMTNILMKPSLMATTQHE